MFSEVANYRSDCRCIFPNQSWVSPSAYFLGVASIVLSGIALKDQAFFGRSSTIHYGTSAYHLPQLRSVVRHAYERCRSFVKSRYDYFCFQYSHLVHVTLFCDVSTRSESQSILAFLGKGLAVLLSH